MCAKDGDDGPVLLREWFYVVVVGVEELVGVTEGSCSLPAIEGPDEVVVAFVDECGESAAGVVVKLVEVWW